MKDRRLISLWMITPLLLCSCFSRTHTHRLEGKIFHAVSVLEKGGPGTVFFALYNDQTYQVCISGRISQDCFNGHYSFKNDTLTLHNLTDKAMLKYNRLLLCPFADKDSSYWQWKYGAQDSIWRPAKEADESDGTADLWQLAKDNRILNDSTDFHFMVIMDKRSKEGARNEGRGRRKM